MKIFPSVPCTCIGSTSHNPRNQMAKRLECPSIPDDVRVVLDKCANSRDELCQAKSGSLIHVD